MRIKRSVWSIPYVVFLILFVVLPLMMIVLYAFQDASGGFSIGNFIKFFTQTEALHTFVYSIEIALLTTLFCLILGYPAAWILSNAKYNPSKVTIILFFIPMWINCLVRTLSTVALFDFLRIPLGEGALLFGMVYDFLPFMIYPIYNVMRKMDKAYVEAAQDLGAKPLQVLTKVTLPLSVPGISSGILMVFMPTMSTFAIAELLTMNNIKLFGTTIQENVNNGMWNYGAALALIMLLLIGLTSLFSDGGKSEMEGGIV